MMERFTKGGPIVDIKQIKDQLTDSDLSPEEQEKTAACVELINNLIKGVHLVTALMKELDMKTVNVKRTDRSGKIKELITASKTGFSVDFGEFDIN